MKKLSRRKFTELFALGALAGCAAPPAPKQQPVDWTLYSPDRYGAPSDPLIPWRLVATSDLIVWGTLTVPQEFAAELAQPPANQATLSLSISKVFKGAASSRQVQVSYWKGVLPNSLDSTTVLDANGKEVICFLDLPLPNENGADSPYDFLRHPESIMSPMSPAIEKALEASIEQQRALVIVVASYFTDHVPRNDGYVGALIEKLFVESTAHDAAQELLSLGQAYAAAMVRYLDDRRPVLLNGVSIPGPSWGFEGIVHYDPEVVLDLLSLALSEATKENLGTTYNGGSERARRRVVDAWRVWLGRSLRLQAG